jgi:hypothetical protein
MPENDGSVRWKRFLGIPFAPLLPPRGIFTRSTTDPAR